MGFAAAGLAANFAGVAANKIIQNYNAMSAHTCVRVRACVRVCYAKNKLIHTSVEGVHLNMYTYLYVHTQGYNSSRGEGSMYTLVHMCTQSYLVQVYSTSTCVWVGI